MLFWGKEKIKIDNKCKYNDNGYCTGQKNAPKCYYNANNECDKYNPKNQNIKGIRVDIKASLNWEKICRYLIYTYNLNEEEIGSYLEKNLLDYAKISFDK